MSNENLLQLASSAGTTMGTGRSQGGFSPNQPRGVPPQLPKRPGEGLREAMERGQQTPEFHRPERPKNDHSWNPEARRRLQGLKQWRTEKAETLELDPALLWPAVSLERMALIPEARESELMADGAEEVRSWQRREFAEELERFLTSGRVRLF